MVKKCNNCGFQQNEFLKIGGKNYCVNCNSEIKNVNSNQISVQKEKTAHQLKLALGNLRFTLEALEKYFERAYGNDYPSFKSQLYERKAEDDNYPLENSREQFLTQLLIMRGVCKGEPEFFRNEIKKEFNKWFSVTGIDVNNCPDEIKNFLFEVNEVLEDRGEKIVKENEARIKNVKFEPKGVIGLFGALQEPMNRAREERENYKGKNWNELGNESRFNVSDEQGAKGQEVFNKISQEIAPKQSGFSFYPQQDQNNPQQTGQLMDNGNFAVIGGEVYLPVNGPNEVDTDQYNIIQQDLQKPINNLPLNVPIGIGGGIAFAVFASGLLKRDKKYFKKSLS